AASTDILNFKTPEWQPVLTDIAVVPDATSAAVSWTGNSESYEVEYKEAGATSEPFFDDFENGLADKGWKVYTQGETAGGEGWFIGNTGDTGNASDSGHTAVFAESWAESTNGMAADNWLISPLVDLGGTLKFWQWIRGEYPDEYEVLLSTTGDAIEDFTTTLRPLGPGLGLWNEVVIDLSAYEGQQGYIAIHHKCTDQFFMAIDDFGIYRAAEWAKVTTTECQVTLTDLQPETTYELRITGFSDGEAEIVSDIVSFTTEAVPGPVDLVLDCNGANTETIQTNDGASANVTIANLTLKKNGKWQAVCLPFDIDVENSVLAGADVRTLESITVTNGIGTLDCLTPHTTMEANKPYILRWDEGEDIVDPVFEDITIRYERMNDSGRWLKIDYTAYFGARYDYIGIMPDMFYLGDESPILTKTDTSIQLHAFEGIFFIFSMVQSEASVFVLNTGYEDDLITGITSLGETEEGTAIYNLAGQRLNKAQKGINIVGGRKVLK
ncbi:MAG: choice-of-anchor J domain-containing protein, partial [Bacteroidales bacterium]|nr:choice-of-anchor J domain-containing protein [Bacteroidales bacterium]